MAEVYWIRRPDHTDILSQGYIGQTKYTAQQRFRNHVSDSKSAKGSSAIRSALRKYGEEGVIVETLVVCSPEYAVWLENKLRPTRGIGWNMAIGGEYPAGNRVVSEETREKMRKASRERANTEEFKERISRSNSERVVSEETREKIGAASRGRKRTRESVERSTRGRFYSGMKKNVETYSIADLLYSKFLGGTTYYYAEKELGRKTGSLQKIFLLFEKGWIPTEDEVWRETYLTNEKEPLDGT